MKTLLWFTTLAYVILLAFFFVIEKTFGYPAIFFQKICSILSKQIEKLIDQRRAL